MSDAFDLASWVQGFSEYPGIVSKKDLASIRNALGGAEDFGWTMIGLGDDAGVVRDESGYLLLTADGMRPEYVRAAPYHAGRSAVLVNVSDIYAMGGRPLAAVNILSGSGDKFLAEVLRGLKDGAKLYRVPIIGGHYHPDAEYGIGVAMLGRADALIRGDRASPGEEIIAAYDLEGQPGRHAVLTFDAVSGRSSAELLYRLEALFLIASAGWASGCRDISNGGLAGTLLALLRESGAGASVDLAAVPRPDSVALGAWLLSFPSYGFVLTVRECFSEAVLKSFTERGISASVIGVVQAGNILSLSFGPQSADLEVFASGS